ncbi:calcium:proton antiporter [Synechococcus sp. A15-60]|uniref:calcium:proton antiporter n=1 Tax=Synechococcus sp. A15-60 TaxID=1050655 RepID=UPI0016475921|nr:calcium:proton antiporter [Synechococcus sp. A15-60]QNI49723.1 Ca2+:H+ antiporter [Synechococcus sp. A15-60]
MDRTLRDCLNLLKSDYVSGWSLLLLPALLSLAVVPSSTTTTMALLLRFLGLGVALIPLARVISRLVDHLSDHLGDRYSGVVSVGLGNLVELVVSIMALRSGLYKLVVISVAGAVITNCLLMLGISTVLAGQREQLVTIQASSTELQARQLMLSLLLLAIPTIISLGTGTTLLEGNDQRDSFALYSLAVAVMILIYYVLSFVLQLGTHRSFFSGNPIKPADPSTSRPSTETEHEHEIAAILIAMGVVSLAVVAISEPLVQTLEVLVAHTHLSELFIGLILLPLFGSTAEGVIAVGAARRGRMDLAITSTMESSGQLMLFVLPVLVLIGWPLGRFLHLSVPLNALGCTGIAVLAVHWITENNQLDWYEGMQLITLYGVILLGCLLL